MIFPQSILQKCFVLIFIFGISMQLFAQTDQVITTFILIRHAEKSSEGGGQDPELSTEGNARATKLAEMFSKTKIDAIYSTNYKRTQSTVRALSEAKGIAIKGYEPKSQASIDDMLKLHAGKTVLMVGHSNTIPWTANHLLGKETYQDFTDDEYGSVIMVSVFQKGRVANSMLFNY
jgi:broad specificity phosphatase PhoE